MPDRQNVVLVLCDQLRGNALSCAGDPNVDTPTLDAMADRGTHFADAHATYPVCVPSRFTLLTGQHAHTRHVPSINYRLSPEDRALPDLFGDAGYETAWVGKWHLYDPPTDDTPVPADHHGFDHWRGFDCLNEPWTTTYFADDDPDPRALDGHQTTGLTDLAVDYLDDRSDDRPFFLGLSVEAPHPPFRPPEAYADRWQDRAVELPPNVPYPEGDPPGRDRWGSLDRATTDLADRDRGYLRDVLLDDLRAYYATVEHLDAQVGRLLDALADRGLRENTTVVFLSDHGEMLGAHGLTAKQWPYRDSTHVPFLVDGPDVADRTVERPTCTEDWLPTLLGLAGLDAPDDLPGANLAPVARGEEDLTREAVLLQFVREERKHANMAFSWETWRSLVTPDYRYAVKGGDDGATPWHLFDRRADPHETTNLVDDPAHADAAADLHRRLRDRLDAVDDPFPLAAAFDQPPRP